MPSALAVLATLHWTRPALTTFATPADAERAARALLTATLAAALAGAVLVLADRRLDLDRGARQRLGRAVLAVTVAAASAAVVCSAWRWTGRRACTPRGIPSALDTSAGSTSTSAEVRVLSLSTNRYDVWRVAARDGTDRPLWGYGAGASDRPTSSADTPTTRRRRLTPRRSSCTRRSACPAWRSGSSWASSGCRLLQPRVQTTRCSEAAFAAALCAVVQTQVDWDFQVPAVTLPVVALLAAGAVQLSPRREVSVMVGRGAGAALLAGGLLGSRPAYLSARLVDRAGADGNVSAAHLAARLNPFAANPYVVSSALLLSRDARGAVRDARRAASREPSNWATWIALSRAERATGDAAGARRACRHAQGLYPRLRCGPLTVNGGRSP